jgi:CDP-paratose 2-epimerase
MVVTGAGGLVGSATVEHFVERGYHVIGVDNNQRAVFFGPKADTSPVITRLLNTYRDEFTLVPENILNQQAMDALMRLHQPELVVHAAAQPAHDWAAKDPMTDFEINAKGTLTMLEAVRRHAPDATFVYCSTSKVYGDNPNRLPLQESWQRLDLDRRHRYFHGIDTTMSVESCTHSLFGVSKLSADLMVQEYGRYFHMPTVCFRPGCISGANHQGVPLHGFLSYLMRCTMGGDPYTIIGYDGLQVRCNIHAKDLVRAFDAFHGDPCTAAVYNIGGGRDGACSMIEAIEKCERIAERPLDVSYESVPRIGDHRWWISDNLPFRREYDWELTYTVDTILEEIYNNNEAWLSP